MNETVRASLQLLKKKPRGRGVLGRGSSMSESTDTISTNNEPQDSTETDSYIVPQKPPPQQPQQQSQQQPQQQQPAKIKSNPPPQPETNIPNKVKKVASLPRSKPTAPSDCTRNSDCTCSLCAIPFDELPVVEITPDSLPSKQSNDSEPMIGSSKLTTLMKKRQEMNQQNTGKKKSSKSNM